MATSPSLEGKFTIYTPRLNCKCYRWWKIRPHYYIMAKDSELQDIVIQGPHIPTKNVKKDLIQQAPKCRKQCEERQTKKDKSVVLKVSQNDTFDDNMEGFEKKEAPIEQKMQTTSIISLESQKTSLVTVNVISINFKISQIGEGIKSQTVLRERKMLIRW